MKKNMWRLALLLLVIVLILLFFTFHLDRYLSFDFLKNQQVILQDMYHQSPIRVSSSFVALYVGVTALSIPGAAVMTLASGLIFGFWPGLFLASIGSTLGATFSFLGARFLFRDFISRKFGSHIEKLNSGMRKDGAFYLLSLRLVPFFPFFLVNLAMGLTQISVLTYMFISQLGMLAGTAVYVNAGTQLSQINTLNEILSPSLLISFTIIGLFPLFAKIFINAIEAQRKRKFFRKPKAFEYNLVVIGAGSAGLVSSYIAAAINAKVALIEKHKMGGDCLNTGCVPSKALIRSAKIASDIRRTNEFGISANGFEINFPNVMERVRGVVSKIEPHDSIDRYQKLGVDCLQGEAEILSPYEVRIGSRTLTTRNIIVATGARPILPEIPGLKDATYLTSDTVWELREKPRRMLVLGGGPIGCELAQAFCRLGVEVTLVEMGSRVMGREDMDVSSQISAVLKSEGINILTSHKALRFGKDANSEFVICANNQSETRVDFSHVLVALGRQANTAGFGLENLEVEINENGTIRVNDFLQTTYSNIYACGDVAGPYQFTHTAAHQAWYATVNALFRPLKKFKVDYRVIPWCTFVDPEVARVGLNENEAKNLGVRFEISTYDLAELDRAITDSEARGFVRVLTKPGSDHILGVTIVGSHAGELITEYVSAMKHGIGLKKILSTIHIYPTFSEANKYAAGVWQKNHKPEWALNFLRRFHTWRR